MWRWINRNRFITSLAAVWLAGCVTTTAIAEDAPAEPPAAASGAGPAPIMESPPKLEAQAQPVKAVAGAQPDSQNNSVGNKPYLIGPGDVLQFFVWRNPDLSVTVPVRPDGKVSIPLVEDLTVIARTPNQVARDVEKALATYIKSPIVTVIIIQFGGIYGQQIRIIGAAIGPKAMPYQEEMSLLDAMISVGGLTEFAAGNRSKVVRKIDGKSREIPARLEDLLKKGDISANMDLMPGDVIIIPQTWF